LYGGIGAIIGASIGAIPVVVAGGPGEDIISFAARGAAIGCLIGVSCYYLIVHPDD